MKFTETHPPKRGDHFWLRLVVGLLLGFTLLWAGLSIGSYSWNAWRAYAGYLEYEPQEGDVIFQSLPYGPVVLAIEGVMVALWSIGSGKNTGSTSQRCLRAARRIWAGPMITDTSSTMRVFTAQS